MRQCGSTFHERLVLGRDLARFGDKKKKTLRHPRKCRPSASRTYRQVGTIRLLLRMVGKPVFNHRVFFFWGFWRVGWARGMRCWRFAAAGGGSKPFTTKRVSRADEGPLRKKCYRHCKRSGRGSQKQNWLIFVSSFTMLLFGGVERELFYSTVLCACILLMEWLRLR